MWPQVGHARRRNSKYSWARALTSSATTDLRCCRHSVVLGSMLRAAPGLRAACGRHHTRPMARQRIPEDVLTAAHERAAARAAKDWPEADRLRAEIEAAGWKVVDRGTDFALEPAHPQTVEAAGVVRYGTSSAVPSRLGEPATDAATVVLVATDWPDDLARALDGLRGHRHDDVSIVVVADGMRDDGDATLPPDGGRLEVVRTSERLGTGAAWNVGIRRAGGRVIVIVDTSVEPTGDLVTPLIAALDDASVGVAGGFGLVSSDLRHFEEAGPGDVTAIEGHAIAFRR